MHVARSVRFYLDLISPYTWLALERAQPFGREHRVQWDLRPVVYSALLDNHGLVGPAETSAKRRYTFHDVARVAGRIGVSFVGPPAHPFRSIEALRTLALFRDDEAALPLAVRLARACWSEGRDLADLEVLGSIVDEAGLPAEGLPERVAAMAVKRRLRESTEEALERGVFGVPTFVYGGEQFWGHDRMDDLGERLLGVPPPDRRAVQAMLDRPAAAWRRRAPEGE